MKGNCETCGEWMRYRETDTLGYCKLADSTKNQAEHRSLAVAFSDTRGKAYLQTHATFGCVQWWQKR